MTRIQTITAALESRGLLDMAISVAKAHGVTVAEMLSRSRLQPVAQARHYLLSELRSKGYSYPYIAQLVDLNHKTVMEGVRKVTRQHLALCGVSEEPPEPLWQRALRARSA